MFKSPSYRSLKDEPGCPAPPPSAQRGTRRFLTRREVTRTLSIAALTALLGCRRGENQNTMGALELIWGRLGVSEGRFQKPRAMAIDGQDRIYVVDMTARIQVFDAQGCFLRAWQTPKQEDGKPTGLSVTRDGRILVADTHYYRVLVYSPEGKLLQTIGGTMGEGPGEFGLVSDAVQDSLGNLYVAEYEDRIQKLSPDGRFLLQWGGHGSGRGQLARPQNLAVDEEDRIWVADACNHRIQVFDNQGNLIRAWGTQGHRPGQLCYPYDLVLAPDGSVYVCEYGNNRIQRFTRDGRSLGCWGTPGRGKGQLNAPWALVCDSQGRIHVLDTNNHRVQKVKI